MQHGSPCAAVEKEIYNFACGADTLSRNVRVGENGPGEGKNSCAREGEKCFRMFRRIMYPDII